MELLLRHDLALIEAAHPNIELALQAEGEAALDELHGFFKRNVRSRRNQSVEMVGHDDECVQEKSSLAAIVEDGLLKQFRSGRDLKKSAALRGHSGDQIRSSFLWRESHCSSIYERPVAKAAVIRGWRKRGLDPHCGYPAPAPSARLCRIGLQREFARFAWDGGVWERSGWVRGWGNARAGFGGVV